MTATRDVQGSPGNVTLGSRVTIYNETTGRVIYYTHLTYNSLRFALGETVNPGDELGTIGPDYQANGTPPHLHIDVVDGIATGTTTRPGCSRDTPEDCAAITFIDFTPELTILYNALSP